MKKKFKFNPKTILMTLMSIFTLMSCFTAVFAWFTAVKISKSDADEFVVSKTNGLVKKITLHRYDKENSSDSAFAFFTEEAGHISFDYSKNPVGINYSEDSEIRLDKYDPLDQSQPLLLVFELFEPTKASSINITANTTTTSFVGEVTNSEGNPLSSVVQFSSTAYSSDPRGTGTNFNVTKSSLSSYTHFVDVEYDEYGFPSIDEEDGFRASNTLYKGQGDSLVSYVAVLVDYYPDAMTCLFSTNLGNPLFDMDINDPTAGIIYFDCDWKITV